MKKELLVLFTELILPILEALNSITYHQRYSLLKSLLTMFSDEDTAKLLIEIYLNFDCSNQESARSNVWERLINALSKLLNSRQQDVAPGTPNAPSTNSSVSNLSNGNLPPAITTETLSSFTKEQVRDMYSSEGDYTELKKRGLDLLTNGILKKLVDFCKEKVAALELKEEQKQKEKEQQEQQEQHERNKKFSYDSDSMMDVSYDDPTQFEEIKHKKQSLQEGIEKFNWKPKRGLKYLIETGHLASDDPKDVAVFLLNTEGLNKTQIGEYLGEGDDYNIQVMHAFVDLMSFNNLSFVTALRVFLQSFRLPGEAQKIDRFMLKFAERYLKGNPQTFSSADTAYVLAYSVVMLNTDLHNDQVKNRMTKAEFVKNNRGIDEGKDLPKDFLEAIYDDILKNEIVMNDKKAAAVNMKSNGTIEEEEEGGSKHSIDQSVQDGSRFYILRNKKDMAFASEDLAMKTEAEFYRIKNKTGSFNQEDDDKTWYTATHHEHIKSMIEVSWMSILTGLSAPIQESDDPEIVEMSLDGFKYSIYLICLFDMELEKKAFISTVSRFTQLNNMSELKPKNIEAMKYLLEIACMESNHLDECWKEVCMCISQLEKLQLLGGSLGMDNPDSTKALSIVEPKKPVNNIIPATIQMVVDQTLNFNKPQFPQKVDHKALAEEFAEETSSQTMVVMVDKIFSSSVKLSASSIVQFVKALCEVSMNEIQSTANSTHPRMFSLQKLVEISYYNMSRIRVEWTHIWNILGEHFNQVASHENITVSMFALDKLRQLSMKFLEMEELPNYKFQKDFLKPFEYTMAHTNNVIIKDMVLTCLLQMIQAKLTTIRSGYKAILGVMTEAAKEQHIDVNSSNQENYNIIKMAFDIVKTIYKEQFNTIVENNAFSDFITCLVAFAKNRKSERIGLQAVNMIKETIPLIIELSGTPAVQELCYTRPDIHIPSSQNKEIEEHPGMGIYNAEEHADDQPISPLALVNDDPSYRFWFPILFGFYEIIMTGKLEVRTRALNYIFETLKEYGNGFSKDFWNVITRGVLFPIFDDLKLTRSRKTKFANSEEMNIWLSTTLIKALRSFIDLFSFYYDKFEFLIDELLELLSVFITQENEILSKIGSTCLQEFLEMNTDKLSAKVCEKVCRSILILFDATTPYNLFDGTLITGPQLTNSQMASVPDITSFEKEFEACFGKKSKKDKKKKKGKKEKKSKKSSNKTEINKEDQEQETNATEEKEDSPIEEKTNKSNVISDIDDIKEKSEAETPTEEGEKKEKETEEETVDDLKTPTEAKKDDKAEDETPKEDKKEEEKEKNEDENDENDENEGDDEGDDDEEDEDSSDDDTENEHNNILREMYMKRKPLVLLGQSQGNSSNTSINSLDSSGSNRYLPNPVSEEQKRVNERAFHQIIIKCILQLMLVRTLNSIVNGKIELYNKFSSEHIYAMLNCLTDSYIRSRDFNNNAELRLALYYGGFMSQIPNLLNQETTSVSATISLLLRMYLDDSPKHNINKEYIEEKLIPLCMNILRTYNSLDYKTKKRNIRSWKPIVAKILNTISEFPDDKFEKHIKSIYPDIINTVSFVIYPNINYVKTDIRDFTTDGDGISDEQDDNLKMKLALHRILIRSGEILNKVLTKADN
jgi:brefeldin A-inhibited guanine nucleotide-exchange protein